MLLLLTAAHAGGLDGMVALDVLSSGSREEGPGAGPAERLGHPDLGMRLRLDVRELDDRGTLHIDYRGREAVLGNYQNSTLRLLFRAEGRYRITDTVTVGLERFVAASPTFTVVDGVHLRADQGRLWGELHAGRRAISTSRVNLGGFLPALGFDGGIVGDDLRIDASIAWSEDRHAVGGTGATQDIGGVTGQLRAVGTPTDALRIGGQASFTQGDTYAIGPTWADGTVEAQALGLFQGSGWASYQPADAIRLDLDLLHQNVQSWSVGLVGDDPDAVVRPRFTDLRLRARIGPKAIGWFRPMVRYRIRPDRRELRLQARVDVHDLGVPGLFLRTMGAFDDIRGEAQAQDVGARDRTIGSASLGYRNKGFDGSLGASYVQRGATPVSARTPTVTTS